MTEKITSTEQEEVDWTELCKHCGCQGDMVWESDLFWVQCTYCESTGPAGPNRWAAIAKWNYRENPR